MCIHAANVRAPLKLTRADQAQRPLSAGVVAPRQPPSSVGRDNGELSSLAMQAQAKNVAEPREPVLLPSRDRAMSKGYLLYGMVGTSGTPSKSSGRCPRLFRSPSVLATTIAEYITLMPSETFSSSPLCLPLNQTRVTARAQGRNLFPNWHL